MRIYFVGFSKYSDKYWRAVRIWGVPHAMFNRKDKHGRADDAVDARWADRCAALGDVFIWA